MNPEKRAREIEAAALRAAQKAQRRQPGIPLTREALLQLRVQTVAPWKRSALVLTGLGLVTLGIVLFVNAENEAIGILVGLAGLCCALWGAIGWRQTLEAVLETLANGMGEAVLNAIVHALD